MRNTAGINGKTVPSGRHTLSRFHPGNRAEVLIEQTFQPTYPDRGWKNRGPREPSQPTLPYQHMENFTENLEASKARSRKPGSYEETLKVMYTR